MKIIFEEEEYNVMYVVNHHKKGIASVFKDGDIISTNKFISPNPLRPWGDGDKIFIILEDYSYFHIYEMWGDKKWMLCDNANSVSNMKKSLEGVV